MGRDLGRIGDLEVRIKKLDTLMSRTLEPGDEPDDASPGIAVEADWAGKDPQITQIMVAMGTERTMKYPLYKSTMTIGRASDSDIQIRRQYISRHHAKLCTENGDTFIEDLGSKNGVLVNAAPVTRHRLRNGDLVDLGQIQFKFIDLLAHSASEGSA